MYKKIENSEYLISVSNDTTIKVWDFVTTKCI